jgi:hypothetical protein
MLDLTGHMIIWGGLFAHGDGSTGLMKVVLCYALPTVCQITIKNVQVQLTVKGKTTPDNYTPTPKSSCAQHVVVLKWSVSLAPNHRPMFMDDNARPHRARIVQHVLQQKAVQTISWPAMSPDMNPLEHVWDFIGRKINRLSLMKVFTIALKCRVFRF